MLIEQLPATALRAWLDDKSRAAPLVLDVREPWEHNVCHIAGAQLLPMQEIPARVGELPQDRDIVVMCHHGMRSLQVANYLQSAGVSRVYNLSGGIAAWADQVEPAMSRY
ncbi:MAG: sulfurtransferase [Betaproteobacteria bacterium]|nr:sulfurtransferase [Betaproteobacteria bacterium]